ARTADQAVGIRRLETALLERTTAGGAEAILAAAHLRHCEILPRMSILKVARMGHPVLRAKARPIDPNDIKSPRIQQLIDDMFETMQEYQGVGLAAPQIHHGLRLFVAGFPPRPRRDDDDEDEEDMNVPLMAIINPEITVLTDDVVDDW